MVARRKGDVGAAGPPAPLSPSAQATDLLPPSGNTGEKSRRGRPAARVFVDWCRVSFDECAVVEVEALLGRCGLACALVERSSGWRGYARSADIVSDGDECVGVLAWGGCTQGGRMTLDLSGAGCAVVRDWRPLVTFVSARRGKVGRIDLAADFLDGRASVRLVRRVWRSGGFASSGRPPTARLIDDCGSDQGSTFYVGDRESPRFLRCYEKGKELGMASHPWTRIEVELKSRAAVVVPFAALTAPGEYFVGAYRVLGRWVSAAAERLAALRHARELQIDHAIANARRQAGGVVYYLARVLGWSSAQIMWALMGDRASPRLVQGAALSRMLPPQYPPWALASGNAFACPVEVWG